MRSTFSSDTLRLECLPALDNKLPVSLSCLSHFIIETNASCEDCLSALFRYEGLSMKKRRTVQYPNLRSAIRPIPHSDSLPVPSPPENCVFEVENEDSVEQEGEPNKPSTSHDSDFEEKDDKPHRLSQAELSDLIRDLDLSKEKAEILGSRLQQWNLLERDVRVSQYRRHRDLLPFFEKKNNLVVCCSGVYWFKGLGYH
ncbi:hypothetical protein ANN_25432 [Periplaneta americana]|uniref:Uncharacterized protein n=1 Tax=Periplaneta americana TaxID=6978 RepID=A0ABQ8S1A7_PERAM|nr:hypothetical protein ANN_25432 [Periplaneta americana]